MNIPNIENYYVATLSYKKVGVSNIHRYLFSNVDSLLEEFSSLGMQVVFLQTCNRVEVYTYGYDPIKMLSRLGINDDFVSIADLFKGIDVFRHLIHVVSGLDSLAVGESQIMGQVRKAYNKSREFGCISGELEFLFNEAFKIGRRVRTRIMFKIVDYVNATLDILYNYVGDKEVLIIGTGEMAKDILNLLIKKLRLNNRISVAGRRNLEYIRGMYGVNTFNIRDLERYLGRFDIIISCVSVDKPIIHSGHVGLLKKDVVIIDLGVPPNVNIESCDSVRVYDINDVSKVISEKYGEIEDKIKILYEYVEGELDRLIRRVKDSKVNEIIKQIYLRAEEIRREELDEAGRELAKLVDDAELRSRIIKLLDVFSWSLVKKIYHQHIEVFRRLGKDGSVDSDTILAIINILNGGERGCD